MGREETPLSPRKNKLYDMKKNKSFIVLAVAVCLIFVAGLALLLYPTVSNFWNEKRSEKLINDYIANVSEAKGEDYSAEFKAAEEYNKTLEGKGIPDAFAFISEAEDETYMSLLSQSSNGVMADIPHHRKKRSRKGRRAFAGFGSARRRQRHTLRAFRAQGASVRRAFHGS